MRYPTSSIGLSNIPVSLIAGAAAGLLAAWLVAGSMGLFVGPLRIAMAWLAFAIAAASVWRPIWRSRRLPTPGQEDLEQRPIPVSLENRDHQGTIRTLLMSIGLVCFLALLVLPAFIQTGPVHEIFLVAVFLALLAMGQAGPARRVFLICAYAVLGLGIYRIACLSIPSLWHVANLVGAAMGRWTAILTGQPLSIGATFGGIDFLVLMAVLYAGWLHQTDPPRRNRAIAGAIAILGGHQVYLFLIAYAPILIGWLPKVTEPKFQQPYIPLPLDWGHTMRLALPWNLPAFGAVLHVAIACWMLRWARWKPDAAPSLVNSGSYPNATPVNGSWKTVAATMLLAIGIAMASSLSSPRTDLNGKVFIANQQGRLDWSRPQHDRYGQSEAGMFGVLPMFVQSLGGKFEIQSDPTENLADCDVLLLIHTAGALLKTQQERIWNFVQQGGSLLVIAEPYYQQGATTSNFNDILAPTSIRVRQDVAIPEPESWRGAGFRLAHPTTLARSRHENIPFSDSGASLQVHWPAWPLVVGQWGWSDPGSDAVITSQSRFEAGELLGDLVLAAEQHVGDGTVMVLGNSSSLTNEGLVRGYDWMGRVLGYLANRGSHPLSLGRQVISFLLLVALIALIAWRFDSGHCMGAAFVLAVCLSAGEAYNRSITPIMPDGRWINSLESGTNQVPKQSSSKHLAYIDASHLEAYSNQDWTFDAINGLALNLMRNGYLTLMLPEISRERLERAAILVSIAPTRPFSRDERALIKEFVEKGGVFISTTGAEEVSASMQLLEDLQVHVPPSPVPTTGDTEEPVPMGYLHTRYLKAEDYQAGDHDVYVLFYAGWPVEATGEKVEVLVRGLKNLPVVLCRRIGEGRAVIIADTCFAMNKNLEYYGGEPFRGGYENAHFWRWFISRLLKNEVWIPPPVSESAAETDVDEEAEQ
ncbi:MAG: hypothetical protein JW829_07055 [Pirellulales bacterium]|nr:hypothetical protein [Pirellulales bacterium]